jgi:hypothetical protein
VLRGRLLYQQVLDDGVKVRIVDLLPQVFLTRLVQACALHILVNQLLQLRHGLNTRLTSLEHAF